MHHAHTRHPSWSTCKLQINSTHVYLINFVILLYKIVSWFVFAKALPKIVTQGNKLLRGKKKTHNADFPPNGETVMKCVS